MFDNVSGGKQMVFQVAKQSLTNLGQLEMQIRSRFEHIFLVSTVHRTGPTTV